MAQQYGPGQQGKVPGNPPTRAHFQTRASGNSKHKYGRDQRYADLAPGTVPPPGQESRVVPNDPDIPIPVAFSSPQIPVAEACLLIGRPLGKCRASSTPPSSSRIAQVRPCRDDDVHTR